MSHTTLPPPPHEVAQREGVRAAASSPAVTPPARYPAQAVPGTTALHRHTFGHSDVVVGVVDGPPDTSHPCLTGANLEAREPWWLPPAPYDVKLAEHGTFTASVLAGQPGSNLPGLAPGCRLITLGFHGDKHVSHDPHSAARAIEDLLEAGANIIQYTPAHHTASHDADPMLKRAIAHAIEAGVLVCAPAGNDYGRNSLAPAILPGVLAVGAHRADGAMFFFSNHGPAYTGHGITTLGEAVLGATPGDAGIKARKGTCTAVALVTGTAALLVSLQRHLGHPPNPLAVRDALLATARPCTPDQAHGRPERCLNGYLDLPAAIAHLFPDTPLLAPEPEHTCRPGAQGTSARITQPPPPQPAAQPAPQPASQHATRPDQERLPTVTIVTLAQRPDLTDARPVTQGSPSVAFLQGDLAGRWSVLAGLQTRFPQFVLRAVDPDGTIVGGGHAIPFALHTPERGGRLPDGGWDEMLTWAFADLHHGTPPDSLGALGIWVAPAQRGTGLAGRLLAAMKDTARTTGLHQVLAPVRPTRKHHEPHTPMADYAARTRPDGLPADPWLRTHICAGGHIAGIAPVSMLVAGSLAQWRAWTGLPFDVDGDVVVPGALVPVQASLAHDRAVYAEPNIWVHHPLNAPRDPHTPALPA
ncbi:S8 family serine peptidase [Nonomuraea sp. AD125B]|uniref:S8 family serine peptidase n=1 Tax=Nonomuraea sp. AD125B TaxID=3242897 RepID=UPI0035288B08